VDIRLLKNQRRGNPGHENNATEQEKPIGGFEPKQQSNLLPAT